MVRMIQRRSLLNQHRLTERQEKSFQILESLRQRGALTRTELSQGAGFNIVTVSNYINQFIKQSRVRERGFDISTGGRKPILVELSAKSGFAVGVGIGRMERFSPPTVLVITDLRGQIVHRIVKTQAAASIDGVLQELGVMLRELLETSPVDVKKIQGI